MTVAFAFAVAAQSASTDAVQHAAQTVAILHDSMLDPPSFVLDGAYVTKPNKKGVVAYCYAFRSHNTMGGYSEERAVEDPLDHGKLETITPAADGAFLGYDVGWFAPCKAKNFAADLTAQVQTAAPALYKKTR
jgi:hypothetical protein